MRRAERVLHARRRGGILSRLVYCSALDDEFGYGTDVGPYGFAAVKSFTTQGPVQGSAETGYGLVCDKTYQQMVSIANDSRLRMGDTDFTIAFRFRLTSTGVDSNLGGKSEWQLFYLNATGKIRGRVNTGAATTSLDYASLLPSANVEYSVIMQYTRNPHQLRMKVVGGGSSGNWETSINAPQGTLADDTTALTIAGIPTVGLGGDTRDWHIWKGKVLSDQECTQFLNAKTIAPYWSLTNAIRVLRPTNYFVYQRDGTNHANITIKGTYQGTPAGIEASYNGGAFTNISATIANGRFTGTLAAQTAAQGTLVVRFTNDTNCSTTVGVIGIGDIYGITGQSNASGRTTNFQTYIAPGGVFSSYFALDWKWHPMGDPMDAQSNGEDVATLGIGTVSTGSIWPKVAQNITTSTGRPCAFVLLAKGGQPITTWVQPTVHTDRSTIYGAFLTRVQSIKSACGGMKGILYWQGETDAQLGTLQATYATALSTLASNLLADCSLKFMPAKLQQIQYNTTAVNAAIISTWGTGSILGSVDLTSINTNVTGDGLHITTDADVIIAAAFWSAQILGASW